MTEYPVSPAVETPVLNPDVYLLGRGNKAFIERTRDTPLLKANFTVAYLFFVVFIVMVVLLPHFLGIVIPIVGTTLLPFVIILLSLLPTIIAVGVRYRTKQRDSDGGWIIPGTVIDAETVRIHAGKSIREVVRIRYRFAAPSGVIEEAFVESSNTEANHIIAPRPDTPIYVWYKDDGTYHLL